MRLTWQQLTVRLTSATELLQQMSQEIRHTNRDIAVSDLDAETWFELRDLTETLPDLAHPSEAA